MSTGASEGENHESVTVAETRRVSPADLVAFLPYACRHLQVELEVRVAVRAHEEYVAQGARPRVKLYRASAIAPAVSTHTVPAPAPEPEPDARSEEPAPAAGRTSATSLACVRLATTLDGGGRALELEAVRERVPRTLLQVIALAAPYNPGLARLALRHCRLHGDVLHELAKPAFAALTDLCLDGSPVPEANYATLLDGASGARLRRLSLARVRLDDGECGVLAARLHEARSLRALDLGSNAVGDAGAAALGRALRTNRTLLHLNLADNRVGDEGATELLRSLAPFPLTRPEVLDSRQRLVARLRSGRAALRAADRGRRGTTSVPARRPTTGSDPDVLEELVGPFEDPFGPSETVCIAGHTYCFGNRVLCYLNLAHNRLTAVSARRLARTLEAQHVTRRPSLLRVVLDGNPLPAAAHSPHMAHVDGLLERAVTAAAAARTDLAQRRTTRVRTGR